MLFCFYRNIHTSTFSSIWRLPDYSQTCSAFPFNRKRHAYVCAMAKRYTSALKHYVCNHIFKHLIEAISQRCLKTFKSMKKTKTFCRCCKIPKSLKVHLQFPFLCTHTHGDEAYDGCTFRSQRFIVEAGTQKGRKGE